MKLAVHPRLVEEAVFQAARSASARGDPAPEAWLHRARERAYGLPEGPERDLRFERVHAVAFRRMGLARALHGVFAAHPALAGGDGPVRVGPAPGRAKEGVDLHERRAAGGGVVRSVIASVLPGTLADPQALARRLHRDAAKTADLLDPAFGWREDPPESTPARKETVRIRYGAAWDAWTDGRLQRRGLPAPVSAGEGEGAFAAVFAPALGEEAAREAFLGIRGKEVLTHGELLRFARSPGGGLDRGPILDGNQDPASEASRPRPGSPCPLCRFPTHDWVPDPEGLPAAILAAARASVPSWTPEEGMCGQCALLYRGRRAPPAALPA